MGIAQTIRSIYTARIQRRPPITVSFAMEWDELSVAQYRALMDTSVRHQFGELDLMEAAPRMLAALCAWKVQPHEWEQLPADKLQAALKEALKSHVLSTAPPAYWENSKPPGSVVVAGKRYNLPRDQNAYNKLPFALVVNHAAQVRAGVDNIELPVDLLAAYIQYREEGRSDIDELDLYRLDVEGANAKDVFRAGFFLFRAQGMHTKEFAARA